MTQIRSHFRIPWSLNSIFNICFIPNLFRDNIPFSIFAFQLTLTNPSVLISASSSARLFHNDGFSITAAEPWFKVKVKVLQSYLQTFITQAMGKADALVYVDLFA